MKRSFFKGTCYRYFYRSKTCKNIVLIHGLGLNQDVWTWQIPFFNEYNILIYDLLGHGDSKNPGKKVTLDTFSAQLNGLIEKLSLKKITLIGFSLGSMISRKYSINYAQKVEAIILLNSPRRVTPSEKDEILNRSLMLKKEGPSSSVKGEGAASGAPHTDEGSPAAPATHPEVQIVDELAREAGRDWHSIG